jgi:hypothetical protein
MSDVLDIESSRDTLAVLGLQIFFLMSLGTKLQQIEFLDCKLVTRPQDFMKESH